MKPHLNRLARKYSQRILRANPAELVVINLEIALDSIAYNDLPRARQAICLLAGALDFRYDLSAHLFNIYAIIEKKLNAGIEKNNTRAVGDAKELIGLLLERWRDTAASFTGLPEQGRQKSGVYVGLTYNKAGLCEYTQRNEEGGYKA